MLYVQLDANWPDNYKIIEAGIEGAGLHAIVMCLAKRMETDGWVRRPLLHRQGATDELIDRLVDLHLLDADGTSVRPHDWLARNPSQAAIGASRANKVRAGRAGNHSRYGHPGALAECSLCGTDPPETPSVLAPAIADSRTPLADARRGSLEVEVEVEPEVKPAAARASEPASSADQRQERLAAAAKIIGDRVATRPGTRDPAAMSRAVANGVRADRHAEAYVLIANDPSITAADLAELLEPPPERVPVALNPSSRLLPVEDVMPHGEANWEEGARAVAGLRQQLGIPRRRASDGADRCM